MSTKLAIVGGKPVIEADGLHYQWPVITESTRAAVMRQMDESISIYNRSGVIARLEDQMQDYHGSTRALLTNSGTSALYSMYMGANLHEGDEVICPAYTFFATVTPLFFTGALPVLVDIRDDGNIAPEAIEDAITDRTKAIVVTHMWGLPCDMDPIRDLARKRGLLLFEDSSHAVGAIYKSQRVGSFGDAAAFSLQAQKPLTGGEGGVLLTNDDQLFYRALALGHYNKRCKVEIPERDRHYKYAVTGMGQKLRIHPLAAAIAEEQFQSLERILEGRRKMAGLMIEKLGDLPGLSIEAPSKDILPSWYALIIKIDSRALGGLRAERLCEALKAEGCLEVDKPGSTCPLSHHPLFQNPGEMHPLYSGKLAYREDQFPVANQYHKSLIKLPVWHDESDLPLVESYLSAFAKVFGNHGQLL
jgi:perosamine synthetase